MPASRSRRPKVYKQKIKVGVEEDENNTLPHTFIAIDVDAIRFTEVVTPEGRKSTRREVGSWVSGWTKPADETDYSDMKNRSIKARSEFLIDTCYSQKIDSMAKTIHNEIETERFQEEFANQSRETQQTWLRESFAKIGNTDNMKDQAYTIRITDADDRDELVAKEYLHFQGYVHKRS